MAAVVSPASGNPAVAQQIQYMLVAAFVFSRVPQFYDFHFSYSFIAQFYDFHVSYSFIALKQRKDVTLTQFELVTMSFFAREPDSYDERKITREKRKRNTHQ